MALSICSLNSGSNGNCYYVGNEDNAVLIDVGISCREVEKRMLRCGLSVKKVRAIFISHEHSDHIKGLEVFAKKHSLPVYITTATMMSGRIYLPENIVFSFKADTPVTIGNLTISAFNKYHDAAEPHSFTVSCGNVCVGIFTDIGRVCKNLISHFKKCNAAFLEANYDDELLNSGSYPYFLKERIRGGRGHLSNAQALDLFINHRPKYMSHLLLAHLSKDNNCPVRALQMFSGLATGTEVVVASRYAESSVYHITAATTLTTRQEVSCQQYSLFQ